MSQTERILYLDKRMRTAGCVTVAETAEHFEVSTRQVKRDIEYLRDRFNAPIVFDKGMHSYHYEKKFTDLEFADQNLVTSFLALQSMAQNQQYMPVYAENMLAAIGEEVPSDYRALTKKITYQVPQTDSIKPEYFEDICASMRDNCCLDITYTNLKGEESRRKIEPMQLINYNGSWYVVSFDRSKDEIRTFHLSRITTLALTSEKFAKHGDGFKKEVASFVDGGFGIFHGAKTTVVKIRFYDVAARIVSTQTWHSKQKMTHGVEKMSAAQAAAVLGGVSGKKSGTEVEYIDLEFPAADFTEVLSRILSFSASARPLEPKELVTLWKDEVKKLSAII